MRHVLSLLVLASLATPLLGSRVEAQSETLVFPSDAEPFLRFGASVSLDGTRLLVGALGFSPAAVSPRAYVFQNTPAGWVEEAKLEPSGAPGSAPGFGVAVELQGDVAFVGASDYPNASGQPAGAVFVFEKSGGAWGSPSALLASDAATTSRHFGKDVEVDSGRLVVAGDHAAYVFELVGGVWTESAALSGEATDVHDVDVRGNRVALGHTDGAYVFELGPTGWDAGTKLPTDDLSGLQGGFARHLVALGDDRAAAAPVIPACQIGHTNGYEWIGSQWRRTSVIDSTAGYQGVRIEGDRLVSLAANRLFVGRCLPSGGVAEEYLFQSGLQNPVLSSGGIDLSGNVVVLGGADHSSPVPNAGVVSVVELRAFSALPENVSVESGGTQHLELRRGPFEGFALYWVFGSASGTASGITVDGLNLPLNFDAYYLFLAVNPNAVVFPTIGILDGHGKAPARIELPPLDLSLVGATLHHAFLTVDFSNGPVVDFASNAVPLRFTTEVELAPQDFEGAATGWDLGSGASAWQIVAGGECGAASGAVAFTTPAPSCGADLGTITNARLSSPVFRLGEVGDWELRFDSLLTSGLEGRVRLFVDDVEEAYFEVAWPEDFAANGALESLAFHLPGIEHAIGRDARFEFLLNGTPSGGTAGWWIDNVELVKLP